MRRISMSGEKNVVDLLLNRSAEREQPQGPTIEQEREAEADRIAAAQDREGKGRKAFANLMEHATQAARSVEAADSDLIEAKGAKVLQAKLESWLNKGGLTIDREEFRPVKAHKSAVNDRYAVTDEALIAYHAHILLASGGTKTAKCVVSYDATKPLREQYMVEDVFYDSLDQKRPMTEEGIKAYMAGEPAVKREAGDDQRPEDEKPLVFFNSAEDVVGFEDLEVPKHVTAQAVHKLKEEGFEIDVEYLGAETGVGKQAYVVIAAPDRHEEMRTIVAAIVDQWDDTTWFDRAMEDHDKYGQGTVSPNEQWYERTLQKEEMPNQPHDWFERSLEKPEQEGIASGAYSGTKMLRFERKRQAQAKTPAKGKAAQRRTRRARRQVRAKKAGKAEKQASQKEILDAAETMERLARSTRRPF